MHKKTLIGWWEEGRQARDLRIDLIIESSGFLSVFCLIHPRFGIKEASNLEMPVIEKKIPAKACCLHPKDQEKSSLGRLLWNCQKITALLAPNTTSPSRKAQVGSLNFHPCWAVMRWHQNAKKRRKNMGLEKYSMIQWLKTLQIWQDT